MAPLPPDWTAEVEEHRLLIAGDWSRSADRDVLRHAVAKLLPMVRSARRTATLHPIGDGIGPLLRLRLRRPGVVFGSPPRGAVLLCPVLTPALVPALAAGIPAVVSPEVADALAVPLPPACRVGRLDRSFVLQIVELLGSGETWSAASAAGPGLSRRLD